MRDPANIVKISTGELTIRRDRLRKEIDDDERELKIKKGRLEVLEALTADDYAIAIDP